MKFLLMSYRHHIQTTNPKTPDPIEYSSGCSEFLDEPPTNHPAPAALGHRASEWTTWIRWMHVRPSEPAQSESSRTIEESFQASLCGDISPAGRQGSPRPRFPSLRLVLDTGSWRELHLLSDTSCRNHAPISVYPHVWRAVSIRVWLCFRFMVHSPSTPRLLQHAPIFEQPWVKSAMFSHRLTARLTLDPILRTSSSRRPSSQAFG